MISRPLFISVAESMVIFPPIVHVGWLSASSTVTPASASRARPRNGPPEAVMTSRSTTPGGSPVSRWCSAVCSESMGISRAPVASASVVTSSPPTTSDSLLASATSMPSVSATIVGPRPAEPTMAFSTRSAPDSATSRTSPSGPASTSPPVQASAARAAASGSLMATRVTPCARACATTASCARPADSPTISNASPARCTTSSACVPIEPVEPRMRSRRTEPLWQRALNEPKGRRPPLPRDLLGPRAGGGRLPGRLRPAAQQRPHEPDPHQQQPHRRREHEDGRAVIEHVGDEDQRRDDRHGEEHEADDQVLVGGLDDVLAVALVKAQPVRRARGDQAHRRGRGGEQRREVQRLLEVVDLLKALRERHREQEREEDLHPGERDAQLVEE